MYAENNYYTHKIELYNISCLAYGHAIQTH